MDAGTTFLRSDSDNHLWIIISDPKVDAENILIVTRPWLIRMSALSREMRVDGNAKVVGTFA